MIAKLTNRKVSGSVIKNGANFVNRIVSRIGGLPAGMLAVVMAALISVTAKFVIAEDMVSAWIWLPALLAALAIGIALVWLGSKPSPVPARSVTQAADLYGMRIVVGSSGKEATHVSFAELPLGRDIAGFIVLDSNDAPPIDSLKRTLTELFSESASLQEAEANFLRILDDQCDIDYAFVGLWDKRRHVLAYFALGFDAPTVMNVYWPHRPEIVIDRKTRRGQQKASFGVHPLSEGERWLFHTPPLVAGPDPYQPFNSAGLIRYAHDSRRMPDDVWVDYLLELGLHTHKDSLPPGALLLSVECKTSTDTEPDTFRRNISVPGKQNFRSAVQPRWRPDIV